MPRAAVVWVTVAAALFALAVGLGAGRTPAASGSALGSPCFHGAVPTCASAFLGRTASGGQWPARSLTGGLAVTVRGEICGSPHAGTLHAIERRYREF